ncbi:MAG: 4Fe-4S dicluster domain-containing protein [Candidatus Thorarchaeota archaeon]
MSERKFVIGDPEVCTGCMICSSTCSMYYFKVISPHRSRVRVQRVEPGLDFPLFCKNCEDAPCIQACPNDALSRTSKGIIIVNNGKCTTQGECVRACPYNAITINPDTGKAIKCIQCGQCVKRCPVNAIWTTTDEGLAAKDSDGRLAAIYETYHDVLYSKEESP